MTARSTKMKWHKGPTLAEALDEMTPFSPPTDLPLRFCVQDVYRFDERRIIAGRVETGTLKTGDALVFPRATKLSSFQRSRQGITTSNVARIAGDSIGISLTEQIFVKRGSDAP